MEPAGSAATAHWLASSPQPRRIAAGLAGKMRNPLPPTIRREILVSDLVFSRIWVVFSTGIAAHRQLKTSIEELARLGDRISLSEIRPGAASGDADVCIACPNVVPLFLRATACIPPPICSRRLSFYQCTNAERRGRFFLPACRMI